MNMMFFLGSRPQAMYCASWLRLRRRRSAGILPHGDGVHVDDAVQAVVFVLQRDPVFNGAHIRPERQIAAGLNAGKDAFLFFHVQNLFCLT
jgi:hypothetical protein